MWYIVIGIIVLGVVAAIAGYFRNRKWQKMLERGEISEIPEAQELVTDECCGQHETCERDSLLPQVIKKPRNPCNPYLNFLKQIREH